MQLTLPAKPDVIGVLPFVHLTNLLGLELLGICDRTSAGEWPDQLASAIGPRVWHLKIGPFAMVAA
jgi:hypothetical protein